MRTFSLIAVLAAVLIAAWFSASWMLSLTGDGRTQTVAPHSTGTQVPLQGSPVDMANELASMDRARQKQMEALLQ